MPHAPLKYSLLNLRRGPVVHPFAFPSLLNIPRVHLTLANVHSCTVRISRCKMASSKHMQESHLFSSFMLFPLRKCCCIVVFNVTCTVIELM